MKTKFNLKFILSTMLVTILAFSMSVEAASVSKPTILATINKNNGIQLEWSRNKACDGYYLYRKVSGGSYKRIATIKKNSIIYYTDKNVTNGKTYTYKVKAYKGSSVSTYSKTKTIKRVSYTTVSVANKNAGVQVSWKKVSGATKYAIYYKKNSSWVKLTDTTSTSYIDKSLKAGDSRSYTVRVYNGSYYGALASSKTMNRLVAPKVTVTPDEENLVFKLSWNAATGAKDYIIYRRTTDTKTFNKIATTTNLSFIDETALSGIDYIYTVKARNGNYVSSYYTTKATKLDVPVLIKDVRVYLPSSATRIEFTYNTVPAGYTLGTTIGNKTYIDMSEGGNGSVVAWMDGETFYISTQRKNVDVVAPVNSSRLFSNLENIKEIKNVGYYLDTSKVKDMSYMFAWSSKLESLYLKSFDTSKVTDMSGMFDSCESLNSVLVSLFDTSNVKYMGRMFSWCHNLTELNVSNFNTSKVVDMEGMFNHCENITKLNLSNFDTSNVINMTGMFMYAYNLKSLNISSFNTSKVKYMQFMFRDCESLTSLDIRNFKTSNVEDMYSMFENTSKLKNLTISNKTWSNTAPKDPEAYLEMFDNSAVPKASRPSWYK